MPVNITEEFVRQLMAQVDFLTKQNRTLTATFRSEEGAQEYLTIMSYIGSARKHGIDAFTAIREALNGNPDIIFNERGSEQIRFFK